MVHKTPIQQVWPSLFEFITEVCAEVKKKVEPKSTGACAKYVRAAIQRARGEAEVATGIVSAKDYGPWLVGKSYKLVSRTYDKAVNGDVAVLQGNSAHVHGHIAIYCAPNWYSDFKQNNFYIWVDGFRPPYAVYARN